MARVKAAAKLTRARKTITAAELVAFEARVAEEFAAAKIRGPVHLSGGNEDQLLEIFREVDPGDWVFSTYRSHYHALLHGIPSDWLMAEILSGRSMNISSLEHRFFTSAIVGGTLPIAVGVAAALKRQGSPRKVWCFVGDMCSLSGAFHEAQCYSENWDLPIRFVIENNGLSCNSPTILCWSATERIQRSGHSVIGYSYKRTHPHVGVDKWVQF